MNETEQLLGFFPEGMFADADALQTFIDSEGMAGVYELLPPGMFESVEQLESSFGSKKKDDGVSPSEEVALAGVSPSELPSIDEQIERLRGLRGTDVRIIEGQEPSSVMMGTSEADGRFFAHPTLFPKDPDGVTQTREEDWLQLEGSEAFDEAVNRGELFEFASQEEADLFAKGAWKFTGKEAEFEAGVASEKVRQAQEKVDEYRLDGGDLESEEFAQLVAEAEAAVAEEEAALGARDQSRLERTNRINAGFGKLVDQEVTRNLIDRGDEEQVVREMNMRFGDYGFTFDTSSFFGDAMTVTADNGEQLDVNLDPWSSGTEYDEAEKLRAFLKKNKVDSELLLQERDLYESDLLLNQMLLRAKRDEASFLEAEKALTDFIKEKGTELNEQDYAVYEDLFGKYDAAGKKLVESNEEFQSELILFNEELEQYNKSRAPKGEKLRALERTFGDNEVSDWMGDMDNAVEKGQAQGGTIRSSYNLLTNANDVTDEEILDYLRAQETLQAEGHSDEFEKFMRIYRAGGESWGSFASALANVESATVLPELFLSSSAAMLNPEVLNAALAGFGAGALIGASGFSLGPLGVLTSFGTGITMAMVAAGTALESGLSFGEFMNEELAEKQGVGLEDIDMSIESIREVLSDPEAMSRIRYRSGGRGIAIGTVNALAAKGAVGAGMRVSKNLRRGRRFFAGATTAGVGMIGEGLGESAGRFVAGQKQDAAEIGLEALAPAPITVAATAYTLLKTPQYTLNGEAVSGRAMVDFVRNGSEAEVAGATIEIKNDETLSQEAHAKRNTGRQREVIKAKLRQAGFTDEEQVDKLAELEMERSKLRGLKTQRATNRLVEIEEEIKAVTDGDPYVFEEEDGAGVRKIMRFTRADAVFALAQDGISNPTESEIEAKQAELYNDALADIQAEDAVQERETAEVDVEEQSRDGAEVGVEEEEAVVDEEEAAVEEEAEELAAQFEAEGTPDVETEEDGVRVVRREGAKNTAKQDRIVRQAQARVKSLAKLGINVALYQTTEQYNAATGKTGRGVYDNKTIHINLEKANSRTMGHEAFHAMFLERIKSTDADAKAAAMSAMQAIRKVVAKDKVLAPRIDQFLEAYNANEQIDEEALAEIFGYLADGYPKLSAPKKNAVKNAIVELFYQMTGVRLSEKWTQGDQNILDLFNTLAAKVEAGEEIEVEDLAGFDVTKERKAELEARAANDERLGALQEKRKQAQQARDALISELTNLANITADVRVTAFLNNLSRKIGVKGLKKLEAEMRKVNKNEDLTAEQKAKRLDALEAKYEAELKKIEQARKDAQEAVDKQVERIKPKAKKILDKAESQSRIEEINAELRKITAKLKRDKNEAKRNYEGKELAEYVKMLEDEANEQRAKLKAEKAELRGKKKKVEEVAPVEEAPVEEDVSETKEALDKEKESLQSLKKKLAEAKRDLREFEARDEKKKGRKEEGVKKKAVADIESAIQDTTKKIKELEAEIAKREAASVEEAPVVEETPTVGTIRTKVGVEAFGKLEAAVRSYLEYMDTLDPNEDMTRGQKAASTRRVNKVVKLATELGLTDAEQAVMQNSVQEKIEAEKRAAEAKETEAAERKAAAERAKGEATLRSLEQQLTQAKRELIALEERGATDSMKAPVKGAIANLEAEIAQLTEKVPTKKKTEYDPTVDQTSGRKLTDRELEQEEIVNRAYDRIKKLGKSQADSSKRRYLGYLQGVVTRLNGLISAAERTGDTFLAQDLRSVRANVGRAMNEFLDKTEGMSNEQVEALEARFESPYYEFLEALKTENPINAFEKTYVEALGKGGIVLTPSRSTAEASPLLKELIGEVVKPQKSEAQARAEALQRRAAIEGISVEEMAEREGLLERQRKDTLSRQAKRELDELKGKTDKESKAKRAELKEFMANLGTMSVDEAQAKRTEGKLKAREQRVFVNERGTEYRRAGESRMRPMTLETIENFVYRSGKVTDKAEPRGIMDGGRSTGHFGTGAYFFSDRKRAEEYDDRDVTAVDIRDYNLAPASLYLHKTLRKINGRVKYQQPHTFTAEEVEAVMDAIRFPGIQTPEIRAQRKAQMPEAERAAEEATRLYNEPGNIDSASTSVMKALGYDGVYATPGSDMDNSTYGTVIYDVKPKAREQRVYEVTGATTPFPNESTNPNLKVGDIVEERAVKGDKPTLFEYQMVNPNEIDYVEKELDYDAIVRMPTTRRYIRQYQQGEMAPPARVVRLKDGTLSSLNRRRIVAAREAGIEEVPAWVETTAPAQPSAREQRASEVLGRYKFRPDGSLIGDSRLANELRGYMRKFGFGVEQFGDRDNRFYIVDERGRRVKPDVVIASDEAFIAEREAIEAEQREAQAAESLARAEAEDLRTEGLKKYQDEYLDFPAEMIEPSRLSPREQRESIEDATRGFSVEAVVKFAKERGYSNKAILAVRPEAQAAITAYEAQANRVNTEIDGIIEKTRERARRDKKAQAIDNKGRRTRYINDRIEEDVLEYLRGTKMYEDASDVGRENMERAARKRFRKLKAAPPVQRVLSIDNEGKAELKDQIKAMARSSKATAAEIRRLTSDFAKDVAELRKGGVLTASEAALLIKRFGQVNPLNPVSVERFEAFVKKYFDRADYRADIAAINTLRKKAKANAGKKTGVNRDFMPMLETILRVSPELLPDVEIDGVPLIKEYRSILEELSKRKAVLDLRPRTELRNKLSQILTEIDKELSLKEDLKMKYEEFVAESEKAGDSVSENIAAMVDEGEISTDEAAVLKKYMRELAKEPTEIDEEAKAAERLKERNRNIAAIQALPALTTRFEMREENDLVRDFNALIKTDAIEALTDSEIKNILRVADNIANGFLPHMTEVLVEKMVAETKAKIVLEASSQTLPKTMVQFYNAAMAKVFPKRLLKRARRTPTKNFDQVMGNYKGTPIYDAIFRDTAGSYARYSSEITNIQERLRKLETKLYKSLGRDPNKVTRAKYVIGAYMMQKEFENNPDIRGVFSAKQLLKASIERSRSNEDIKYSERQGDMLESILKEIDELGEVEGKALSELMWEKMMTPAMKGVAKGMREINDELTDKAAFTAGVLRGIPFSPISQYFHRVVQAEQKTGVKDSVSIIEAISKNFKPSTRAKNLIQRTTKKAPAVNFDPFVSVNRGSKYILVDYHLTRPIRTTRRVISRLGKDQSEMTKQQRLAIGFLREATQSIDENVLTDAFVYDDNLAKAAQYIKKTGYQLVLASIPRAAVETFTNFYFGTLVEPASFIEGIKHVGPVSENAPSILRNVKSVQTTRLFPESDKSLKSGVVDQIRDSMNPTGADVKSGVRNVFGRLYNYSAQPFREGVGVIASKIITRPDQMISRPIWFGKFARTFRKETGVDVDFDAIANNDEEYMTKYAEAIDNATKEADRTSVRAGATDNPYLASLRYMGGRNRSVGKQMIATIDGYMMRFMITEFVSFRTGVQALVGNGTISREKGIRLMAGTFGRMMGYVMALSIIRDLIARQFLDDDDDFDLEKEVTDSFLSSVLTVMAGTRGQLARGIMAIGSEAINEYHIKENYDRPFEYKDRFAYPLLDLQKSNQTEKMLLEGLIRVSGPYAPAARAVVTGAKAAPGMMDKYIFDELKATEKGQQGQTNLERKLLLQSLGLLGLFPFYTDVYYNVQRYQNQIYDQLDESTPLEETLEYQMLQDIKEQQKEIRKSLREQSGQ